MSGAISHIASRLRRVGLEVGVDRAVAYTLVARGWPALSGALTAIFLVRNLSLIQRSFYFTFANVLGLQIVFELGLSYVVLQFASHERARLEWTEQGTLAGDPSAKSRLASLLRASLLWYCGVGILIVLMVFPIGLSLFGGSPNAGAVGPWRLPWLWCVVVSAGMVATSPVLALLEGCGLVAEVASMQAVQNILRTLSLWVALIGGIGLYAAPLSTTVALMWAGGWIWHRHRHFLSDLVGGHHNLFRHGTQAGTGINWRLEVWPLQWRIAVSWFSGYFIFQLFNPALVYFHRTAEAGQMGLSMNIVTAISTVALAWMTTKAAPFGRLIALKNFKQLDNVFFRTLWQSLAAVVLGGGGFWFAAHTLQAAGYRWGQAVLPPLPLALLIGAAIINHISISQAIYLRAHKQEPFLLTSLLMGAATALSVILLGKALGALGMMIGYFLVSVIIGLGCGTWIFAQKRRFWHQPILPALPMAVQEND